MPQVKLWSREHQPAEMPMWKVSTFHSVSIVNVFDSYGDGGLASVINVGSQDAVELPFDSGSEVNYCFVIGQVEDCNGVLGGDGVLDECGVCDNDPGNDGFLDECERDSDPTNDCEQDCEGTWGGDVTEWETPLSGSAVMRTSKKSDGVSSTKTSCS